jgi:hypothetical protein
MRTRLWLRFAGALAVGTALTVAGCSLDVTNPNSADEQTALTTAEGLQALAVGMQAYWANTIVGSNIINSGVTSRELTINMTYINQVMIEDGGSNLDGSVGDLATLFGGSMNVMRMAEQIIEHAPTIQMDAGTRSGIVALAHLYKGMALGTLVQLFEQAPIQTDLAQRAAFKSRADVLAAALQHLATASDMLKATAPSTYFNTKIKGSKIDLLNTIAAHRARYLLYTGQYQAAIDMSKTVDAKVASYYSYDALNNNPLYAGLVQTRRYAPRDNMGTTVTEAGDARLAFFLVPDATLSNPKRYPIEKLAGFGASSTAPIPTYVPGEMALIRAESYLRLGNLTAAVQEIDFIRTKKAANDPLGLGANLPAYSGPLTTAAITTEIYRQRASELYMQGLRWDDQRRLGRPGPPESMDERNRNFYPYPDQERLNNPNCPANPMS